jgi:hypothetical protein
MPDVEDMEPDQLPFTGLPKLRFSELMIDSLNEPNNIELGEFIEIVNIGEHLADPRRVRIELLSVSQHILVNMSPRDDEGRAVLRGLKPIKTDDHFLFIRQDTERFQITAGLPAGTFYEYGRWGTGNPALANSERTIELTYIDPETEQPVFQDRVSWAAGRLVDVNQTFSNDSLPIIENVSFSLNPSVYNAAPSGRARDWCYETDILPNQVMTRASPGEPLAGTCRRSPP